MSGSHNHAEIKNTNLNVPKENLLGERGAATSLGQVRLGPARLAHCMRWIGQAEVALNMMIERVAEPLLARVAAGREAGHPVDDRGLDHGTLPIAS